MNEIILKSSFAGIKKKETFSILLNFKRWSLLLCCGLLLFSSKISAQQQRISFVSQDMNWKSLIQQAQTQNKLVFIYVYDSRSDVCRQVESEVFSHPSVAANHNHHFVNYKVDGTVESSKNLITAFNITYFPTLLFFDADENLLHNTTKALPASVYLSMLEKLMEAQSLFPIVVKQNMNQSETLNNKVIDSPNYNAQPVTHSKSSSTSSNKSKNYSQQEIEQWKADYYSKKISAEDLRKYAYSLQALQHPYHAVVNQYLKREKAKLKEEINRQFLYDFSETVENDAIHFFLADIQHFKVTQGSEKINNKIKSAIRKSILTAIEEHDKIIFDYAIDVIQQANLPFKDAFAFEMKTLYYSGADEWQNYAETAIQYVEDKNITDPMLLNQLAYNIALHLTDTQYLEAALAWANTLTGMEKEYHPHYTLAYVLFRLKRDGEAMKVAEEALKIAQFRGIDPKEIKRLIDDIRVR